MRQMPEKEMFLYRSKSYHAYPKRHRGTAIMALLFISVLGFGYIGYRSSSIFLVPDLTVTEPQHGSLIQGKSVQIQGETEPGMRVTINGYEVLSEDSGDFAVELPVQKGFHILDIRVKNRVGKESKIVRHITVE